MDDFDILDDFDDFDDDFKAQRNERRAEQTETEDE